MNGHRNVILTTTTPAHPDCSDSSPVQVLTVLSDKLCQAPPHPTGPLREWRGEVALEASTLLEAPVLGPTLQRAASRSQPRLQADQVFAGRRRRRLGVCSPGNTGIQNSVYNGASPYATERTCAGNSCQRTTFPLAVNTSLGVKL